MKLTTNVIFSTLGTLALACAGAALGVWLLNELYMQRVCVAMSCASPIWREWVSDEAWKEL